MPRRIRILVSPATGVHDLGTTPVASGYYALAKEFVNINLEDGLHR